MRLFWIVGDMINASLVFYFYFIIIYEFKCIDYFGI
jgi:hypothetical protein